MVTTIETDAFVADVLLPTWFITILVNALPRYDLVIAVIVLPEPIKLLSVNVPDGAPNVVLIDDPPKVVKVKAVLPFVVEIL